MNPDYVEIMRSRMVDWLGTEAAEVLCVGCEPIDTSGVLI
jgi:hypothetical protein